MQPSLNLCCLILPPSLRCSSLHHHFRISLLVVLLLCAECNIMAAEAKIVLPGNETIPAVLIFGDSIVDAGNNNNLKSAIKANFLPYGRDFEGGVPTGRFCNGRVPSDMIASELGIKDTVPAYLDPDLKPEDLLTGVTFASGGAGYDPLTPTLVSVISLTQQLEYFKEYKTKLTKLVGENQTDYIVSKSLYLVVAGSDDIANTYFISRIRQFQYDVPTYTSFLADQASDYYKKLYDLGARRIGVFNAPPLGCLPSQRTLAGGLARNCAEDYNNAAQLYNSKLSSKINSLNKELPHVRIVYIDIYAPLLDLIESPDKYGFKIADKGCCGTGKIEVVVLCNQFSPFTCSDASSYVFWDSYHPTEEAYGTLLPTLVRKYVNDFFCGDKLC
uniref:GDSL esterase/lipase EXL3 n=1 Tax=Kalanchoe fedtschenkoi TaxID=63787 RepID=A0A7N0V3V5_KALFE